MSIFHLTLITHHAKWKWLIRITTLNITLNESVISDISEMIIDLCWIETHEPEMTIGTTAGEIHIWQSHSSKHVHRNLTHVYITCSRPTSTYTYIDKVPFTWYNTQWNQNTHIAEHPSVFCLLLAVHWYVPCPHWAVWLPHYPSYLPFVCISWGKPANHKLLKATAGQTQQCMDAHMGSWKYKAHTEHRTLTQPAPRLFSSPVREVYHSQWSHLSSNMFGIWMNVL